MLKRKLFFWLERLKITKGERRSVVTLMVILLLLVLVNAVLEPQPPFERTAYTKIEQVFNQKTALLKQEHQKMIAPYRGIPASAVRLDTLPEIQREPININKAGIEKLTVLPGIGPVYAQNIIEYRQQNGAFTSKKELLNVAGIGDARLAKIASLIAIDSVKSATKFAESVIKASENATEAPNKKRKQKNRTLINVNKASVKRLITLPGIGDAYAQNIIEYRRENGPFTAFEQLLKVDGIGQKRLENLIPFIKLTDETE